MKNIFFAICLIFVCFIIALIFIENRKNVVSYDVNANFLSGDWWKTATVADVEKEIQNGADVNAKNVYGYTVLMTAAQNTENPEIIAILIKHGANVNAKNKKGKTVWDYAKENPNIYFRKDIYLKLKDLLHQ